MQKCVFVCVQYMCEFLCQRMLLSQVGVLGVGYHVVVGYQNSFVSRFLATKVDATRVYMCYNWQRVAS